MYRTTTTAALLVTVAVSALAGCVTVQHTAAPGGPPDNAPSRPAAPRPDGSAQPRVVQAPAREALEMVGPSPHPEHTTPADPHRAAPPPAAPPAPPAAHRPPSPPAAAHHHPRPHPDHPRRPRVHVPNVPPPASKATDVCALGRKYGGWRKDSPEAVICEGTYGH
ncbi:hypothetical protein AQI88_31585 [Streptomyces cellostaticus]|uniref:Lipoprotein n=1 Tax=Streptomyces cellostaticus TaxID=67285 RepID=A0A101NG04_9ACTN|nr:hypothetical protein [Streptomyces cellostaticus]KUM92464.1 hypothetical protein AQI88_31585 [Streptomyces cellostaticus]GHI09306.1 lipoprotein [Streptomyces cellostaticus]